MARGERVLHVGKFIFQDRLPNDLYDRWNVCLTITVHDSRQLLTDPARCLAITTKWRALVSKRERTHERQFDTGLIHCTRPVSFPLVVDICFRRVFIKRSNVAELDSPYVVRSKIHRRYFANYRIVSFLVIEQQ